MTTWTPATEQTEAWTGVDQTMRVFDPFVFDRAPIFDTGSTVGLWDAAAEPQEIWTAA